MPRDEVVEAFDQISAVYDATRDPLDPATLDSMVARLKERGIRSILEVGVGTGRISVPLVARGLDMIGVDASRGMLALARSKGLGRLIRGDAYHLPFADGCVDTTLFVHVLHLLGRTSEALTEAERVSRQGVTALVHPPDPDRSEPLEGSRRDPRRIVYRYLAREGYPVPDRGGGPRARERKLLAELPPDDLIVLSDREVTERLSKRLDLLERRGSRHTLSIPLDVLHRAAEAARAEIGDRTVTYRQIEALAMWVRRPDRIQEPPISSDGSTSRRSGAEERTAKPRRRDSTRLRL
ncbi:MAG TPA: methyltransferase domain-containing protein [Thermoplasmata archaeon]|nr:methyltransferase domain-containing protein [Thermoplasmata archaeon]